MFIQFSKLFIVRTVVLFVAINGFLSACNNGVESLNNPIVQPAGQINGYAIDSVIHGGTVSVYSFANGIRGEKLGSAATDATGAFSIPLQAASQVVLVEVTGGSYTEEASGNDITLADGQSLRSLVLFESDRVVSTNITPLTHMATALAQFKIAGGTSVAQAMTDAFGVIDDFFGVNSRGVTSINITKGSLDQTTLDDNALYGFYMAGLSSWTAWINQKNNHDAHSTYTSVGVLQLMYDDIRYDGLLDGVAANDAGIGFRNLALENVALNGDTYRLAFSLHVIAMARGTQNKTGVVYTDTQLMDAATKIATDNSSPMFPNASPGLLLQQAIDVSVDPVYYGGIFSGQYSFAVGVDSLVGAESITIAVDQASNVVDTLLPLIAPVAHLDLSGLASGTHTIYVNAENIFQNKVDPPYTFVVNIDNDAPQLTFTSQPYASTASIDVTGTYQDTGGAGVQSVAVILGQNTITATLDDPAPGQWKAIVDNLAKGNNPLKVVVTDKVGNSYETNEFSVYLDDIKPIIGNAEPQSTHSMAKFSSGGGSYTERELLTDDTGEPLYIETNNSAFNSTASPTNLDNNGIPYYKFTVSDNRAPSDPANPQNIKVEIQYNKLDAGSQNHLIDDWHVLNRYQACDSLATGCEYYIPLASPFLNADWDQTTPLDTQIINVRVTDTAGNESTAQFSFRADFYAPAISVCPNQQCTSGELVVNDLDPFTGADKFAARDTVLYNATLDTTTYAFTNPSNKSVYIKIAEPQNTVHSVLQAIEQELRYHLANKVTTLQWRGAVIDIPTTGCPTVTMNGVDPAWQTITDVRNWNGIAWVQYSPSDFNITDVQFQADRDDLTTLPQDSGWANIDHALRFDSVFFYLDPYQEDYRLGNSLNLFYLNDTTAVNPCPEQNYFQERQTYSYISLDGPRDKTTSLPSVTAAFNTNGYIVTVNGDVVTTNAEGWYLIPGNANVVITKVVSTDTTPDLVFHEADFSLTASYIGPSVRDSSFTWSIDRNLNITAIHNIGEATISAMSQRETLSITGPKEYVTARP